MPRCWIGLGGNEGHVPTAFADVTHKLAVHPEISRVELSALFRTPAMGAQAGNPFWNAVVGCATELPALDLLDLLQIWEAEAGRVRTVHWGPRPLDLDLLFYGDAVIEDARLTLPHPGAWYRRFVIDPLCTLAPEFVHPVWRLTVRALRDRLASAPPAVWMWSERAGLANSLHSEIQQRCPMVTITPTDASRVIDDGLMIAIASQPPTSWRRTPHLRFDPNLPREKLVVGVRDACTAAFGVPEAQGMLSLGFFPAP